MAAAWWFCGEGVFGWVGWLSPPRSVGRPPGAVAPSIHVQVLLVQIALLLVTVVGRLVLPRAELGAALHFDELPVIQEVLRPSEVHLPEVRQQLALLPSSGLVVRHLDRAGLFVRQRMRNQLHQ